MEKELLSDGEEAVVYADESPPPTGDVAGGGGGNGGGDDEDDEEEDEDEEAAAVEGDVSGKKLEMPLLELSSPLCSPGGEMRLGALYVFNNAFSLVPRSIGRLNRLKILKFFGNEIDVLPPEAGDLVELERLQVKVAWPGLSSIPLGKLQSLKELELCNVPTRASAFSVLTDIARLSCLRKLSVCYLSIRYVPPEIGRLKNLEELDLSFNKLKSLPNNLSELSALRALSVASNKLVNLPSGLSSLPRLENLDLSNNRLTSLASLELSSMRTLQYLNLQYNKLDRDFQVPSWIRCILEENGNDTCEESESESSVPSGELSGAATCQMGMSCSCHAKRTRMKCIPEEAGEDTSEESKTTVVCRELSDVAIRQMGLSYSQCSSSTLPSEAPCFGTCNATKRTRKKWKRWNYFQQIARLERLNHSRKCRSPSRTLKFSEPSKLCDLSSSEKGCMEIYSDNNREIQPQSLLESSSLSEKLPVSEDLNGESLDFIGDNDSLVLPKCADDDKIDSHVTKSGDGSSCITSDCAGLHGFSDGEAEVASPSPSATGLLKLKVHDDGSAAEESKNYVNSKRHYDDDLDNVDLDNPKRKCHRAFGGCSCLSCKYSIESFCGIDDHLPDGFYDAGRDRRCLPLCNYEQILCLDSREVILLDREKDEELDAILLTAKRLLSMLKRPNNFGEEAEFVVDDLHRASMLALFVSDCFGGSDRSCSVLRMRHSVLGSCEQRPFVCTCSTGNNYNFKERPDQIYGLMGNINFTDLCDKSLRLTKESRKSVIVPIGAVRFGVCRHRAVLMKYLCDRAEPPIPCELVRGYLDFMPHAWNTVLIRQGCSWIRMIVDACYPTDIREETDPEYFCRYIPLSRVYVVQQNAISPGIGCSFPSLSPFPKSGKASAAPVKRFKFGTLTVAAKVRNLETSAASEQDIKIFEYTFLGEVRMLGALRKHKCIVEIYGHHLSSTWVTAVEGKKDHRVLQSSIIMECIEGGSLKNYLSKLSERSEKHVPLNLALYIARDVACALAEVHSKHIIHRDIKSENILIDLDSGTNDGAPLVKLCDFDRAVPLHSFLHSCCIAHLGIHPPNACVGTPRWMAPEVFSAMHEGTVYGLEVDIWSYGCLILELLTLKIPYEGLPQEEIQDCLERKQRPQLTPELEELFLADEEAAACSRLGLSYSDADIKTLKLLIDLFYRCTRPNPAERPTARQIYDVLCSSGAPPPPDES
ncbi:hypothetical protein Taro_012525 [Colocasia esculenta]|uniref:Protein kinase domain-containing protein n=1 Tax=Colocasia esculenta TaxID=4460 RepID=A0A843UD09_COLES|nr:hypothetical protein [Colocasia esculenta]